MPKARGADDEPPQPINLPFEEALKRLEAIVEAMEAQDLSLEKLLASYEEGMKLSELCQTRLGEAELKIQQLEKGPKGELGLKSVSLLEENL